MSFMTFYLSLTKHNFRFILNMVSAWDEFARESHFYSDCDNEFILVLLGIQIFKQMSFF